MQHNCHRCALFGNYVLQGILDVLVQHDGGNGSSSEISALRQSLGADHTFLKVLGKFKGFTFRRGKERPFTFPPLLKISLLILKTLSLYLLK